MRHVKYLDWEHTAVDSDQSVLIVGAGTMGHGIALCFSDRGWQVTLVDPSESALARARSAMSSALDLLARVDGSPATRRDEALDRVKGMTALPASLPGVVVEAVPEDLALKRTVLRELEDRGTSAVLICSNTSAISITSLAEGMRHPERFVGTHFWNPPYVLPCVEVVPGDETSEETVARTVQVLQEAGRRPVALRRDVPGFVGNRLQHALQREAMALVESGIVSAEDLDEVVMQGLGLRMALMGPFERADLGGIDVTGRVQEYLLPYLDRRTVPSSLLTDRMARGDLGAKTGKGFFTWDEKRWTERIKQRDETLLRIIRLRDGDSDEKSS